MGPGEPLERIEERDQVGFLLVAKTDRSQSGGTGLRLNYKYDY